MGCGKIDQVHKGSNDFRNTIEKRNYSLRTETINTEDFALVRLLEILDNTRIPSTNYFKIWLSTHTHVQDNQPSPHTLTHAHTHKDARTHTDTHTHACAHRHDNYTLVLGQPSQSMDTGIRQWIEYSTLPKYICVQFCT